MPIEVAPFVASLEPLNPPNSDPVQQGADQIRLVKNALKSTFPNANAAYTVDPATLNAMPGNRARKDIADTFAARMTFTVGADAASFRRGGGEIEPIGTIHMWATGTAPAGFLMLDGSTYSRTTYAALWTLWGPSGANILGPGDGSTTFTTPDRRLRFPVMAGTGTALGSTGGSASLESTTGAGGDHDHGGASGAGGDHNHSGSAGATALTIGQMPAHGHTASTASAGNHFHSTSVGWRNFQDGGGVGIQAVDPFTAPAGGVSFNTTTAGAHTHTVTVNNNGSGETHTHTIGASGTHTHGIGLSGTHTHTISVADARPPFFAVNFIVRAL